MVKKWGPAVLLGALDALILMWLWGAWGHFQAPFRLGQQLLIVITSAFLLSVLAPFLLVKNFHWQPSRVIWHWMLGWLGYGAALMVVPSWFVSALANEIGIGFMLSFFGILCVDAPRNGVLGIRVSWTYASEVVWRKTNQVGGWLLYVGGLVGIGISAWKPAIGMTLIVIPAMIAGVISVVYAYWLSRRPHSMS